MDDETKGAVILIVILLLISFFVGFRVGTLGMFDQQKSECEQSLPRDIECVWSVPVMAEDYETEVSK